MGADGCGGALVVKADASSTIHLPSWAAVRDTLVYACAVGPAAPSPGYWCNIPGPVPACSAS